MICHLSRIVCFVLLALLAGPVDGQPLEVYLFGGQSNQQGIAELDGLTQQDVSIKHGDSIPGVKFWNGKSFEELRLGVTRTSGRPNEFGPEIGFAVAFAEGKAEAGLAIIKHSRSGIALSAGWDNQQWRGEAGGPKRLNFYPGTSADDPNRGTAYIEMIDCFGRALASLDSRDIEYAVKGIIWVQGEQDSKHKISASRYAVNLSKLVDRLHGDLGLVEQKVPFYFAQSLGVPPSGLIPGTGREGDQANRFVYRTELRESMANADADSDHPQSVAGAHMISTDALSLRDDVHYDAAGQIELGRRFFVAVQAREESDSAEDACEPAAE